MCQLETYCVQSRRTHVNGHPCEWTPKRRRRRWGLCRSGRGAEGGGGVDCPFLLLLVLLEILLGEREVFIL